MASPKPNYKLTLKESVQFENGNHGVHVMIWAPFDQGHVILGRYPARAAVLMQMRFDGTLGFPGGLIDDPMDGLDPDAAMTMMVTGLNRELEEEVNVDLKVMSVTQDDYLFSTSYGLDKDNRMMICHFFTMKVTIEQFKDLEKRALEARDFGDEVMGHLRVPLYKMRCGDRGFPRFCRNVFIGCAREQLFRGLIANKIFTLEEIQELDNQFVV